MSARYAVHRLAWDLWQQPELRAEHARDEAAVYARYGLSEAEAALLRQGTFPALAELGMHPLVQMPYSLIKNPEFIGFVDASDYLDDLDDPAKGASLMGRIVGGFGTAHILMKRGSAGEQGERVFRGMKEVGRRARALAPDVAVIVSSDHMYNFELGLQAPWSVATSERFNGFGDMRLPQRQLLGHREFATCFVREANRDGFELAVAENYRPDHGVLIPALMLSAALDIPVVPLIVNTAMDPTPSARRCHALGASLARTVREARPAGERVVVLGTGGLSHWLGVAEMGRINPDFDQRVLAAFESGDMSPLLAMSHDDIRAAGGNGGLEILCWLVMAGALDGRAAERIYYEAVQPWITGMAGVAVAA